MTAYLEYRNSEIQKLHNIYCSKIPDYLHDFLEADEIIRLMGIGQHCGTEYVKIPTFNYKYFYSRLDHSLGVALILNNFTNDKKQVIAGLLHDISSTVFAHVGDFFKKDYLTQEKTERNTLDIIKNSNTLPEIIEKNNLNLFEVSNYKQYPIADNKSPNLSCDRLESTLHYPIIRGEWSLEDVSEIYNNINILKNEDGIDELGFTDISCAEKFTRMSIINGQIDSSEEDKMCMQFLAHILRLMIEQKLINENDLFTMTEEQIIENLFSTNILKIKNAWKYFVNMTQVKSSNEFVKDKYCVKLNVKKRYINPLVKTQTGSYRMAELNDEIKNIINNFIKQDNLQYTYIDYKL